jgi:hypothetical protein
MTVQPDSFSSEKNQELPALIKPTLGVKIVLCLWMTAVCMFYLLMYTPNIILKAAEAIGMHESLSALQEEIKPFFRTEDFSNNIETP